LATGRLESALESLNRAVTLDPRNPLARFKRANVLLALNEDEVCLVRVFHGSEI
jgi:predicted Zn-dependent protease